MKGRSMGVVLSDMPPPPVAPPPTLRVLTCSGLPTMVPLTRAVFTANSTRKSSPSTSELLSWASQSNITSS